MKKGGDGALFVDPALRREIKHVYPAKRPIRGVSDKLFDRDCRAGIGRLLQ